MREELPCWGVRGLGAIIDIARVGCEWEEVVSLFGVQTRLRGEWVRDDGTRFVCAVESQILEDAVERELGVRGIVERYCWEAEGGGDDGSNKRMAMGEDDIKYVLLQRLGNAYVLWVL